MFGGAIRVFFLGGCIGWFQRLSDAIGASIAAPDNLVSVKIICEEDGHSNQRGRRPVARWL